MILDVALYCLFDCKDGITRIQTVSAATFGRVGIHTGLKVTSFAIMRLLPRDQSARLTLAFQHMVLMVLAF